MCLRQVADLCSSRYYSFAQINLYTVNLRMFIKGQDSLQWNQRVENACGRASYGLQLNVGNSSANDFNKLNSNFPSREYNHYVETLKLEQQENHERYY